jgi:2-hydroxyglutaryl-CoA dehydratase, D-component
VPRRLASTIRSTSSPDTHDATPVFATSSPGAIITHPSTCPYVVTLLAAGERALDGDGETDGDSSDCLVVPAGCDAMRRLGDALAARYPDRVFTLFVPRTPDPASVRSLARDLGRLEEWLAARAPQRPSVAGLRRAEPVRAGSAPDETSSSDTFAYPSPPRPGGAFVVAGPLSDNGLLHLIEGLGLHISGVESCSGPERERALAGLGISGMDLQEVATRILEEVSCPRSSAPARREFLARRLEESGAIAAVYARLPFCDPGAYDTLTVERLAAERGLPYLEVEVGFPFVASGPLRVRIEAFLETLLLDAELSELDDLDDLVDV